QSARFNLLTTFLRNLHKNRQMAVNERRAAHRKKRGSAPVAGKWSRLSDSRPGLPRGGNLRCLDRAASATHGSPRPSTAARGGYFEGRNFVREYFSRDKSGGDCLGFHPGISSARSSR